ncbi:MAG: F0F1 ATP synthase subunit epsilon [bacterium]
MSDKLLLEMVTPQRLAFSEEVDEVILPGTLGEFGILPGHVPFFSTLQPGPVVVKKSGEEIYYAVSGGFVEVHEDHVIVLAETAERSTEINVERVLASKARAEKLLHELKDVSSTEFMRAELRLKRALVREDIAGRKSQVHK